MNKHEYRNIFENEETHFYYVSLHNLVLSLVKKYLITNHKSPISILDAGCGTGLLAKKLERFGNVIGVDYSNEAIRYARIRGVKVTNASVEKLPFGKKSFDVVTSVDVIYHEWVRDDQKALSEFYRVLKPGGILVLKVPALAWMSLAHDELVSTKRRYYKKELKQKLSRAGFKTEKLSYINLLLLPFAALKLIWEKAIPSKKYKSNISSVPTLINEITKILIAAEYILVQKINIPYGLGLIAVCIKPKL